MRRIKLEKSSYHFDEKCQPLFILNICSSTQANRQTDSLSWQTGNQSETVERMMHKTQYGYYISNLI